MTRLFAGAVRRTALAPRIIRTAALAPRRWISQSWLAKKEAAKNDWDEQAEQIKKGERQHPYDFLEERGYIHQLAGNKGHIRELLRTKRTGVYCGVDPTADSLHLGHLLPFMAIFWMWMHGYQAATLLGGSTARIGDPTDRVESRPILSNADLTKNITKLHYQMKKLWANVEALARKHEWNPHWGGTHRIINNNTWLQHVTSYDMMKRLGRHMRLGPLLAKESVKRRLENGHGMTVGEFFYPLFQGWDFWQLYSKLGIQLQFGGSDQYGNITLGIECLKIIRSTEEAPHLKLPGGPMNDPYGITMPLLTDAVGAKFGKTSGNAIWLDAFKTTPFDLYGYLLRRPDNEIEKYLKLFTFLKTAEISNVMERHNKNPSQRVAHHVLGFELLSLVHGADVAVREQTQHMMLFGKTDEEAKAIIAEYEKKQVQTTELFPDADGILQQPPLPAIVDANNAPQMDVQLPRSVFFGENATLARIVHAAGMAPSRAEAHRLIKAEGIYVAAAPGDQKRSLLPGNLDWTPAKLWFPGEVQRYIIDDKIFILRRGKHHVRIIEILSEAEFEATGKKYPGQPYTGKVRGMISEVMEQAAAQGVHLDQKDLRRKLYEMEKRERLAKLRPGKMEEKLSTGSSKLVNSSSVNEDRRPGKDWGEKDWSGKENKDPGGKKDEGKDEDW